MREPIYAIFLNEDNSCVLIKEQIPIQNSVVNVKRQTVKITEAMETNNGVNGKPLSMTLIGLFLVQNVILAAIAGWVLIYFTQNCDSWPEVEQHNASNSQSIQEAEDVVECRRLHNLALSLFLLAALFTVFGAIILVVCYAHNCDHQRAYGKQTFAWVSCYNILIHTHTQSL
ncbi:hypothetical protein DPMN_192998 [Dreissena polymorpha]|uniref:Uncharacterized protein n=1 Tax=Dreissena polymorpha TaxID=45954 RepID=A0A9D4BF59_DREPO|nr:hypothetical protein DPMN_192998 [Dreissena polymorpha]